MILPISGCSAAWVGALFALPLTHSGNSAELVARCFKPSKDVPLTGLAKVPRIIETQRRAYAEQCYERMDRAAAFVLGEPGAKIHSLCTIPDDAQSGFLVSGQIRFSATMY